MIIGIGTDMVDIRRIAHLIERFGPRFLSRVFTEYERECGERYPSHERRVSYYAKRFAAKEACVKALNDKTLSWQDIEIKNEPSGRPVLFVRGERQGHVSLSDEPPYAFAFVIIEKVYES